MRRTFQALLVGWIATVLSISAALPGCDAGPEEAPPPTKQLKLALPAGFVDEAITGPWQQPVGITFAGDGRMFVWEKAGRLWEVVGGVKASAPLIDIHEEVGNWRDHGLLGVALHPSFLSNGQIFLLYAVDYHHLKFFGTPSYNPNTNTDMRDTIVRLTRYTARSSSNFTTVDYSTRLILFGESMSTGCPILNETHGAGTVLFGQDGTLLVSCGEGAAFLTVDTGGDQAGSSNTALDEGIISPKEDVGAFRSQLVDTLGGKILRLDPNTGNGIPSNPFYDASAPRAPRSRVWALGLRNPFRMALRPESGSHNPADADPGSLYVGDVGWDTWEELNVVPGPGLNLGWPIYEGLQAAPTYSTANIANLDAPNPLNGTTPSGQPFCNKPFFYFKDLLVQDTTNALSFPNSCNPAQQIPSSLRRFEHKRPVLEWNHESASTRVGGYNGSGIATVMPLSSTIGNEFSGGASIGGVWYTGTDFPAEYHDTYFHGDYAGTWIHNLVFNNNDQLVAVREFVPPESASPPVVALATNPVQGGLYYIRYDTQVRRIRYVGANGLPPVAMAQANVSFGPSPLTVSFTSTGSSDPEGGALTYSWNFGDSTPNASGPSASHTFSGVGPKAFNVVLTVTDPAANASTATLRISVNNTPPNVTITSPLNGGTYSMAGSSSIPLTATLSDAQQSLAQLTCEWQTTLHHNTHEHPEPVVNTCSSSASVTPLGCGDETYYYSFRLRVSDGFAAPVERNSTLYPDCTPVPLAPSGAASTLPTYVWRPVMGADNYNLVVDDSSTTGKINANYTPAQGGCANGITNCSVTPGTSLASGSAQFRVRAHNPISGWRAFSANRTFSVGGLGVPVLTSPSGPGQPTTPTYTFNAVAGATDYQLWVDDSTGNKIKTWYTAVALGCGDGVCSIMPATALAAGACTWWVQAKSGSVTSPWSAGKAFTVVSGAPAAPTLIAPSGTVTTTTPTYQWNASSGATQYQLYVNDPSGKRIDQPFSAAAACGASSTCSVTPATALGVGACAFWVQAKNASGGTWSIQRSFTVAPSSGVPTTAPSLTAPIGTISTTTPSYQFSAVALGTKYYLWVDGPGGNLIKQVYTAAQAGCTVSNCSITPSTGLPNGSFTWWVQAQNNAGTGGPWSVAGTFTVTSSKPTTAPTLMAPSGAIATATPQYRWSRVPLADRYSLWVDGPGSQLIQQVYTATQAGCTSASTCAITPSVALASGASVWWVQAQNTAGNGPWSAPGNFTVP